MSIFFNNLLLIFCQIISLWKKQIQKKHLWFNTNAQQCQQTVFHEKFHLDYIAVPRFRHACRGGKEMKFFAKLQFLGKILLHCRPGAADGTGGRAVDSKQYLAVNNFVCDLKRTEYSSARLIKITNYKLH